LQATHTTKQPPHPRWAQLRTTDLVYTPPHSSYYYTTCSPITEIHRGCCCCWWCKSFRITSDSDPIRQSPSRRRPSSHYPEPSKRRIAMPFRVAGGDIDVSSSSTERSRVFSRDGASSHCTGCECGGTGCQHFKEVEKEVVCFFSNA